MGSSVENLIERVMGQLHSIVKTETVVGEPLTAGNITLIPVSKISFGFAAGGAQTQEGQGGTGGGATVEPIAFVVIDQNDRPQILTLSDREAVWGQLVDLMPEAVARIRAFMGKKQGAPTQEEPSEPPS